jgi:hypothetical protein
MLINLRLTLRAVYFWTYFVKSSFTNNKLKYFYLFFIFFGILLQGVRDNLMRHLGFSKLSS